MEVYPIRPSSAKQLAGRDFSARFLRLRFGAWHQSDEPLDDRIIDRLIGIREAVAERGIDELALILNFGNERFTYGHTPYTLIRSLFRTFAPAPGDIFYDLGAGYGRVLFYGALTSRAKFRGIELVPQRANEADRIRKQLRLANVDIRHGNASQMDFSDGAMFFLYDPFFRDGLRRVGARLRDIAARRTVRIASLAGSNDYFRAQNWLREFLSPHVEHKRGQRYGLRFFISRPDC
jgi:SAM-dependent methyltransferase